MTSMMTSIWYCLGVFFGCRRTWGLAPPSSWTTSEHVGTCWNMLEHVVPLRSKCVVECCRYRELFHCLERLPSFCDSLRFAVQGASWCKLSWGLTGSAWGDWANYADSWLSLLDIDVWWCMIFSGMSARSIFTDNIYIYIYIYIDICIIKSMWCVSKCRIMVGQVGQDLLHSWWCILLLGEWVTYLVTLSVGYHVKWILLTSPRHRSKRNESNILGRRGGSLLDELQHVHQRVR